MTKEHLMIVDGRKELAMTMLKFGAGVIIGVIITALLINNEPDTFSVIMRDIKSVPQGLTNFVGERVNQTPQKNPAMEVPQSPVIPSGFPLPEPVKL